MNKKIIWTILTMLLAVSCSVKKEDAPIGGSEQTGSTQGNLNQIKPNNDTDFDGIPDDLEEKIGLDPKTGLFPKFRVYNLRNTKLTVLNFEDRSRDRSFYYLPENDFSEGLSYTPIRDKIAKQAYSRAIGQPSSTEPVSVFDLGVVKLSNFDPTTAIEIKNFVKDRYDDLSPESVTFASTFSLVATGTRGIRKISEVIVEYGFVSKDGGFESFGFTTPLKNTAGTNAVFSSDGDAVKIHSSSELLTRISRIDLENAKKITNNDYDIALKIVDYKVELVDGSTFDYSSQIQKALSQTTPYALSYEDEVFLKFSARNESISSFLQREVGPLESDGEGKILSLDGLGTTTSMPIIFEEGGEGHLLGKSWFLFSGKDSIKEIPNHGEMVLVGYFRNDYIAKAGGRIVEKYSKTVKDEKETELIYSNLSLGETITISLDGSVAIPQKKDPRRTSSMASWSHVFTRGGEIVETKVVSGMVDYDWADYYEDTEQYILKIIDEVNEPTIRFSSPKYPNSNIRFLSKSFSRGLRPILDQTDKRWKLRIFIDEDFFRIYGDSIKVTLPKISVGDFTYGLVTNYDDWPWYQVPHFHNSEIQKYHSDGLKKRTVTLSSKRLFEL